jgi:hypothetical protein
MSERHTVCLELIHPDRRGPRTSACIDAVRRALPAAKVGEPDDAGFFTAELDAESHEDATQKVFNGIAAAGADDHILIAEHPNVPEHWRHAQHFHPTS